MSLRFRCQQCGKRLQVDENPGTRVLCPYCRQDVTVPFGAVAVAPAPAHTPEPSEAPPDETDLPMTRGGRVLAFVAAYLPSWGTSAVCHLAILLVALVIGTTMTPRAEVTPYIAQVEQTTHPKFIKPDPETSHSIHRKNSDNGGFVIKKVRHDEFQGISDYDRPAPKIETIGLGDPGGMGSDLVGSGIGRGHGPGGKVPGFFGFETPNGPQRISYIVDRSGSMTDSFVYVKHELKRAIRALRPSDSFYVVFYSSGPAVELPVRKMVPATLQNKNMAYEFIDGIMATGQTDPSEALRRTFEVGANTVYLLTDGEFDRGIAGLIDRLNTAKNVSIHTICFIYADGEPLLKEIAAHNSGSYRFVGESDLSKIQAGQ